MHGGKLGFGRASLWAAVQAGRNAVGGECTPAPPCPWTLGCLWTRTHRCCCRLAPGHSKSTRKRQKPETEHGCESGPGDGVDSLWCGVGRPFGLGKVREGWRKRGCARERDTAGLLGPAALHCGAAWVLKLGCAVCLLGRVCGCHRRGLWSASRSVLVLWRGIRLGGWHAGSPCWAGSPRILTDGKQWQSRGGWWGSVL